MQEKAVLKSENFAEKRQVENVKIISKKNINLFPKSLRSKS